MEGFNKIDMGYSQKSDPSPRVNSPKITQEKRLSISRKPLLILIAIIAVLTIFAFLISLPARGVYQDAKITMAFARSAMDAAKKQNIELASEELIKTRQALLKTQADLNSLSFLRFIPVVSGYYGDASHLIKAGFYGLDAATTLVNSVKPYADVLGLKGQGSFVGGTASQRIETAVRTMGTVTPHIDDIAGSMVSLKKEMDEINPNRYPPFFGGDKIKSQLKTIKNLADQGVVFVDEARPLIKILPSLLGEPKEKKYLVLFQNDRELRPTGGFITAYAVFRIERGIIHVDRSDDIYTLDNTIYGKPQAPATILKYLPKVSTFNLRDTNLSPDFLESMKTFNSLYAKAGSRADVDGIIALDTSVLVSTIKILDDEVVAGGIRFTSQKDPRCDCPQVIYKLEELISTPRSLDLRITPLAVAQAQRKDILGTLLYAVMEKALKSSPKLYWGSLFQNLLTQASEKHVLFYLYNNDAQKGVEALNASGRIKSFDGDYLHINEANFGGAKANLFVTENVSQNIEVSGDGTVTKTVTINYKNPYAPSDCNLERGNLCLNAVLRDWIRIYVPKGSQLLESKGSEVKITSYEELGKTVFEGFLTVRPKGVATITFSYRLPFKLKSNSVLPLLIQKQPGTNDNEHSVKVNGREIEKFPLLTDRQLQIKI